MQRDFEIWLDNQLPSILAKWMIEEFGFKVKSSFVLNIKEASDWEIYQRAKQTGNVIIISKDGDFPKKKTQSGVPPKLIKLDIGNYPNKQLWSVLKPVIKPAIEKFLNTEIEIIFIEPEDYFS